MNWISTIDFELNNLLNWIFLKSFWIKYWIESILSEIQTLNWIKLGIGHGYDNRTKKIAINCKPQSHASSKFWPTDSLTSVERRATSAASKKSDHICYKWNLKYMQLFKSCFILDNVANLPREEVLANFKLEFMECCKYELRDRRLKILYLFMKPIYSSGGRKYNRLEQYCTT